MSKPMIELPYIEKDGMLNGRGSSYRRENVELLLTLEDARIFASLLAPVMRDEMTVKVKRVLTAMLEQIPPVTYTTVTALMKHGEDDFSTWIFDMQDEALEQFDHARTRQTADLERCTAWCGIPSRWILGGSPR